MVRVARAVMGRMGTRSRILAGLLVATAAAASADAQGRRDTPPLPFALPCPIDAPVRVASSETLKRFTALDGCVDSAIIVAPATELPRPRGRVVIGPAGAETEDAANDLFFAEQNKGTKTKSKRRNRADPPAALVETANIGRSGTTVVRIAPAVQFPELELAAVIDEVVADGVVAQAAVVHSDGVQAAVVPLAVVREGPLTDATILALRPASYTTPHDTLISAAASRHGVDPMMLHAVITQESRYRSSAVSPVGARGLMQVMPGTGAMLGVRNAAHLMDPAVNIDAGARLLKRLWNRFQGRFDLVLAAYNAGEGAVTKYGYRIPPYRETQNYVTGVKAIYRKLVAERGITYAGR